MSFQSSFGDIVEVTGILATPNPANDVIYWPPVDDSDLAGYVIYYRPTLTDDWVERAQVESDFNYWSEPEMLSGYYCIRALDLASKVSADCSPPVYWAPCAQWNVDVDINVGADWPDDTCLDPGLEEPFPSMNINPTDGEWTNPERGRE